MRVEAPIPSSSRSSWSFGGADLVPPALLTLLSIASLRMKRRRLLFAWPRRSVPIFGSKFFGRCCLRASRPWPQEKEDVMSSIENNIAPADLEMIRSVLDDAGYDASVLVEDQCLFDTAALLVTELFLSGVDSRRH